MSLSADNYENDPQMKNLWILLFCLCCSCATLRGTKQRIKVASTPSGATILYKGQNLGTTPKFVEVSREKSSSIILKKPGFADREVSLAGTYRWGDSIAANFVWLNATFIGVGIGIDYWSGAAWDIPAQGVFKWREDIPLELTPMRKLAIAPPKAAGEVLSDELALRLDSVIREKYPGVEIINYEDSVNSFARYGYSNQTQTPIDYRDDLYFKLGVTHLVETTASEVGSEVILSSNVTDVYTDHSIEKFETNIEKKSVVALNQGFWGAQIRSLVSFAPNTLAFNFATPNVGINEYSLDKTQQYRSRREREDNLFSFLSGFSLKNIKSSDVAKKWKAVFRFVPSLSLGYNRFQFDREIGNNLEGTSFRWYHFGGGIGPELGLEMPVGYTYFDFIPSVGVSVVKWNKDGEHSDERGTVTGEIEFGYLVFLSQNVNLRFYLNFIAANKDQWNSILTRAAGQDVKVEDAAFGSGGFSLGYYFPEIRSSARKFVR
jgi:hypothetical protein